MRRPLVSDELWKRVEPLLPKRPDRHRQYAGRKLTGDRETFEGIVFVLKTGIPWNALPATQVWPSGATCFRRLMWWHQHGVWQRLLEQLLAELRAAGKLDLRLAVIDSSLIRAMRGGDDTGPSPIHRGKPGSKHHLLSDAEGTPLAIELTGANRHDITQLLKLVEAIPPIRGKPGKPKRRPERIQGDRAYDSDPHRKALKKRKSSRSSLEGAPRTALAWARHAG